MEAKLVRVASWKIDIKIISGDNMHVLQWRRHFAKDEVLLDGKVQQISRGLWGRETIYGLVFGRDEDGNGGQKVMLIVDATADSSNPAYWLEGASVPSGVRVETSVRTLLSYGSMDERAYDRPADFAEWAKKHMGLKW